MALRCLLFSSDESTAAPLLQVLAGLDLEGEHCSDPVATVEKVTQQNFQIVIIDWDQQPEATLLLTAVRERKASERPLTLAIVSDNASLPKALQAGANSILRKPIAIAEVRDTLTTARDLLRSRQESAANAAQAAAAGVSAGSGSTLAPNIDRGDRKNLRAGEFLQSAPPAPGGQFVTESDVHQSLEPSSIEAVDPLANLEPMAASVAHEEPEPAPAPPPTETRGLEWYKKTRAGILPPIPMPASVPAPSSKPELVGFDQPYSPSLPANSNIPAQAQAPAPEPRPNPVDAHEQKPEQKHEQKKEAELFAYMAGEHSESKEVSHPRFRMKGTIVVALVLAGCAILFAPQAPWHPKLQVALVRGQHALHGWLNPQPVTPVQAPVAHEDFGRAGDEYKLPVAENIPDATTDPSQIHVLPVVDPTAKKPSNETVSGSQPQEGDGAGTTPNDQTPQPAEPQPQTAPDTAPAGRPVPREESPSPDSATTAPTTTAHADPFVPAHASAPPRPLPPKSQDSHSASEPVNVPSSLKSHMAAMTPDAGGNKAPESAMPSIEPVSVAEFAERALLTDQPAVAYPATAKGQQGTVVLQVLIGRDGSVQDAKFMQGSLAFARAAIDGVKLWKFKPYAMNGRAVSVQTLMTITIKPTS